MINILTEAKLIVYENADGHDYGSFDQNMQDACNFAMVMTGQQVTIDMAYAVLVGLKLAREKQNHKIDNMIDVCGYMAGWADYKQKLAYDQQQKLWDNKEADDGDTHSDNDGQQERGEGSIPIGQLP